MSEIKIPIDTNFHFYNHSRPTIPNCIVEFYNLKEGDRVWGYQDDQEWLGTVGYDESYPVDRSWYLELEGSIELSVSEERMSGRAEGMTYGVQIGIHAAKIKVAQAMIRDGHELEKVCKYTNLTISILKQLTGK